jgi:hypothetical protein
MYALKCRVVKVPSAAQQDDGVDGRPCSARERG